MIAQMQKTKPIAGVGEQHLGDRPGSQTPDAVSLRAVSRCVMCGDAIWLCHFLRVPLFGWLERETANQLFERGGPSKRTRPYLLTWRWCLPNVLLGVWFGGVNSRPAFGLAYLSIGSFATQSAD